MFIKYSKGRISDIYEDKKDAKEKFEKEVGPKKESKKDTKEKPREEKN